MWSDFAKAQLYALLMCLKNGWNFGEEHLVAGAHLGCVETTSIPSSNCWEMGQGSLS